MDATFQPNAPITLEYQGKRYERFTASGLLAAGVPQAAIDAQVLGWIQSSAAVAIDNAAAQVRAKYITTAPGQADTYALKLAEANAYTAAAAAGPPDPTAYPVLNAQATASGETIAAVAAAVLAIQAAWIAAAGRIEAIRVPAKAAVRAAVTADAASAAATNAIDDLNQL